MLRSISREELANSLTHGVGVILGLVGLFFLAQKSLWHDDRAHTVAVCVYGLSVVSVFASSTLHHAATSRRLKNVFLWLDHSCIYALIAGTYTPFMVSVLRGSTGAVMLGTVWGLGLLGVLSKTVLKIRSDVVSIPFYLLMGWLVVLVIRPFTAVMDLSGLALLLAGGLSYSLGLIFFIWKAAYAHAIWHVMVMVGAACHYFAVLIYVTPT